MHSQCRSRIVLVSVALAIGVAASCDDGGFDAVDEETDERVQQLVQAWAEERAAQEREESAVEDTQPVEEIEEAPDEPSETVDVADSQPPSDEAPDSPEAEDEPIDEERLTYRRVGEVRDFSTPFARRFNFGIVVPPGLTRKELEATVKAAAAPVIRRDRAEALIVGAYVEGGPTAGTPTAVHAIYGRNGQWASMDNETGPFLWTFQHSAYYTHQHERPVGCEAGATVRLRDGRGGTAELVSRFSNGWIEETFRVPAGTEARIVGPRRRLPAGFEDVLVFYKVRAVVDGRTRRGWAMHWDVEPPAEPPAPEESSE